MSPVIGSFSSVLFTTTPTATPISRSLFNDIYILVLATCMCGVFRVLQGKCVMQGFIMIFMMIVVCWILNVRYWKSKIGLFWYKWVNDSHTKHVFRCKLFITYLGCIFASSFCLFFLIQNSLGGTSHENCKNWESHSKLNSGWSRPFHVFFHGYIKYYWARL